MSTRIALVTGAASGLGLALVRQLDKAGYQTVLTARSLAQAGRAAAELGADVLPIALDVDREDDMRRVRDELDARYGASMC